MDTELANVHFKDDSIKAYSTDSEHYIARYIIHKKETISRIRFINAEKFESYIEDYNKLHAQNCEWFSASIKDFYHDIVKIQIVQDYLKNLEKNQVGFIVFLAVQIKLMIFPT
ncbi:MAG: hypothetical protein IPQ12_07875 [Polaromonas sp.]|nr:hypothetical protein [Polaromonas sp.]